MGSIEISVVMPGYNEESVIEHSLHTVYRTLESMAISFEIVFVNDGSTDKTAEIVDAFSRTHKYIRHISYAPNRGRGYALRRGVSAAMGEYVLTTESDLNYGADIIGALYDAIKSSDLDIVIASPYMKGGALKNVPFKRAFFSRFGNKLLSASLGNSVHTVSGMVRIYRRSCIQSLPLVADDKEIHLEILSKALSLGFKVGEIPGTLGWPEKKKRTASGRHSKFSLNKYVSSHLLFGFFERPILFFGFAGFFMFLVGLVLGGYIVFLRYTGQLNASRPLITLVVLMIIGGVIVFSFGMLGMQINDIRKEIYRIQSKLKDR